MVNHREPRSDKGPWAQDQIKLTKIKPLCKTNRSKHFDDRAGKVSLVALITIESNSKTKNTIGDGGSTAL